MNCFTQDLVQNSASLDLVSKRNRKWLENPKTKYSARKTYICIYDIYMQIKYIIYNTYNIYKCILYK